MPSSSLVFGRLIFYFFLDSVLIFDILLSVMGQLSSADSKLGEVFKLVM